MTVPASDIAALIERLRDDGRHLAGRIGCSPQRTSPWEAADALAAQQAEIERLRAELGASCGYLLNAKIDLETGAPKRTAIATIEGGLKRAHAALNPTEPKDDK